MATIALKDFGDEVKISLIFDSLESRNLNIEDIYKKCLEKNATTAEDTKKIIMEELSSGETTMTTGTLRDFLDEEGKIDMDKLMISGLLESSNLTIEDIHKKCLEKNATTTEAMKKITEEELSKSNISGGTTTMSTTNANRTTNKFFGLNFEFGPSNDSNIASTFVGVAVHNPANGNWYTFERGVRKNYNTIKLGNLPLMLLPVQNPAVGDLLKIDGSYYYVKEIKGDTITLIGAVDGVIREMITDESIIPGLKFYTKVVALVNSQTGLIDTSNNDVSGNMLAAMFMMNWAKGGDGATFSMDNITDDSFNGLGSYLPLMLASGNGGALGKIFGGMDGNIALPMLMAMSGGNSIDEFTQMMVLSQLMGNNKVTNLINPVTETATAEEVVCTGCGKTYTDGNIKFCPACGKPTRPKANTCPGCNAVLKTGASFCHNCGMEIGKATFCKNCGKELGTDEKFCSACGTPANTPAVVTCKNCGKELGTDEKFCSACGTSKTSKPATPKKQAGKGNAKAKNTANKTTPPAPVVENKEPEETEITPEE